MTNNKYCKKKKKQLLMVHFCNLYRVLRPGRMHRSPPLAAAPVERTRNTILLCRINMACLDKHPFIRILFHVSMAVKIINSGKSITAASNTLACNHLSRYYAFNRVYYYNNT